MKVEVNEKSVEQKSEYPKLMVNKDGIDSQIGLVLALSENEVFHLVGSFALQYTDSFFDLNKEFTPFTGSITLSND